MRAYKSDQERKAEAEVRRQMLYDYIMYEQISSYFRSATCVTKRQEGKLYLQYKGVKVDKQVEIETAIDEFIKKQVLTSPDIPEEFWNSDVEVSLIGKSGSPATTIRITDGIDTLVLRVNPYRERDGEQFNVELEFLPEEETDEDEEAEEDNQ